MAVANIDEAIAQANDLINDASYDGAVSLLTQWNLWIDGLLGGAGVFPSDINTPAARSVRDWLPAHLAARDAIEGPGNTDSGPTGTSACSSVCARVLSAIKFAVINGEATAGQETATVALFNVVWP